MKETLIQGMVWCLLVSFFAGMGLAMCLRFCSSLRQREEDTDWAVRHLLPPRAALSDSGRLIHSFLIVSWSVAAVLILAISVGANLQ